ncbi:MAG: hypothetical protein ACLQE9_17975 [Roseiarcus sp.]
MAPFLLLIALAAPVPSGDPESICRSVRANSLPEEQANAFQNCVNEERAAQEKVRQKWMTASPAARSDCAPIAGIPFSFVAVMTCLEMQPGGDFDPGNAK